jgi:hypothetical protein
VANLAFFPSKYGDFTPFFIEKNHEGFRGPFFFGLQVPKFSPKKNTNTNY